jgi:hypothetical protein
MAAGVGGRYLATNETSHKLQRVADMILISEKRIISFVRGRDHRGLQNAHQLPGVQRLCVLAAPPVDEDEDEDEDSNRSYKD